MGSQHTSHCNDDLNRKMGPNKHLEMILSAITANANIQLYSVQKDGFFCLQKDHPKLNF